MKKMFVLMVSIFVGLGICIAFNPRKKYALGNIRRDTIRPADYI